MGALQLWPTILNLCGVIAKDTLEEIVYFCLHLDALENNSKIAAGTGLANPRIEHMPHVASLLAGVTYLEKLSGM